MINKYGDSGHPCLLPLFRLQKRKMHIPMAEAIIMDIKEDFEVWVEYRKFAPTIKALKEKLKVFADVEIKNQRKKNYQKLQ